MHDLKHYTLISAGLIILAGALVLNGPRWSSAAQAPNPVEVVNPSGSPVPTFDVDNPALQPVHFECVGTLPNGVSLSNNIARQIPCLHTNVPLGKRLVIEFVSVSISLPTGQKPSAQISSSTAFFTGGTAIMDHEIALGLLAGSVFDAYKASQPVRLYSDPGNNVRITVTRNQTAGNLIFDVTWSGYLVDVP